jgi:hypothetical protein
VGSKGQGIYYPLPMRSQVTQGLQPDDLRILGSLGGN